MAHDSGTLRGWKDIANHFGVEKTTVQRWAKKHGLPFIQPTGSGGPVLASRADLDAWASCNRRVIEQDGVATNASALGGTSCTPDASEAKQEHLKPTGDMVGKPGTLVHAALRYPRLLITLSIFGFSAVGMVGLVSAYAIVSRRAGPPQEFRVTQNELVAYGRKDREIWRHSFPDGFFAPYYETNSDWHVSANLDGSAGGINTLFHYAPANKDSAGSTLFCFSADGTVKWKFTPGHKVTDAGGESYETFLINSVRVLAKTARHDSLVIVSSNDVRNYPNQVVALTASGRIMGEYWHSGHLLHAAVVDLDGEGHEELLLAGVNNSHGATLVVLDPLHLSGASAQPPGDRRQLVGLPSGREKAIVMLPQSCIGRLGPYNRARELTITRAGVEVVTSENYDEYGPYLIYQLDRRLRPTGIIISDNFQSKHRELERTGQLDHPFSKDEIDRLKERVRVVWK